MNFCEKHNCSYKTTCPGCDSDRFCENHFPDPNIGCDGNFANSDWVLGDEWKVSATSTEFDSTQFYRAAQIAHFRFYKVCLELSVLFRTNLQLLQNKN